MPERIQIEPTEKEIRRTFRIFKDWGFKIPRKVDTEAKCFLVWWGQRELSYSTRYDMNWLKTVSMETLCKRWESNCKYRKKYTKYKPVLKMSKSTGKVIKEYENIMDAAHDLCVLPQHIYKCASGKIKSAYGFNWEYKTIEE